MSVAIFYGFHSSAYEGGGHLLSLVAFPSTKYTQGVLI